MDNEIWLKIEDVCRLTGESKETVRRKCKRGEYISSFVKNGRYKIYSVLLSSLPIKYQDEYKNINNNEINKKIATNCEEYALAPLWSRKQADKYLELFSLTDNMKYTEIIDFIKNWNMQYPNKKVSYTSYYYAKKKYNEFGISALLSQKGQNHKHKYCLNNEYYEYYKSLYLKEGAPSSASCWRATLGFAIQKDNIDIMNFPSYKTFDRYLRNEIPKQAIYLARYGQSAWNKKYSLYLQRDYSNLKAGSCWVSDHAQIDVAVNHNGNTYFPWVTVFRDVKTSKWLGWFLHIESPNSDHIFQAFYYGVLNFGLPNDIYLDNGKDYRCKDFAGGRTSLKVKHSQSLENSLVTNLGIKVHFALPYNAQTKPVERDFLKIKTFLSKGFVGYRGGKITERPEKLKEEIKKNKIMQFHDFKILFDDFIINYLNKKPSEGKTLQGKSPDELWAEEFTLKKEINKDALKLFCMRTSKNVSIGRNGIYDSQLQITYWSEWMIAQKGRKVFIRRDINAYQEAWVFDAKTEEYLGKGNANSEISFLAETKIEKAKYKKALASKNKEKKILKEYLNCKYNPSNEEIIENLKNTIPKTEFVENPIISKISNTKMDQVINIDKNLKGLNPTFKKPIKKLYLTEGERLRDLMREAI